MCGRRDIEERLRCSAQPQRPPRAPFAQRAPRRPSSAWSEFRTCGIFRRLTQASNRGGCSDRPALTLRPPLTCGCCERSWAFNSWCGRPSVVTVTVARHAHACSKRPQFCRREILWPQTGTSRVIFLRLLREQARDGNRAACRDTLVVMTQRRFAALPCVRSNRASDTCTAARQPPGLHHLISHQWHG